MWYTVYNVLQLFFLVKPETYNSVGRFSYEVPVLKNWWYFWNLLATRWQGALWVKGALNRLQH